MTKVIAWIKCWWYCLIHMWRGSCMFSCKNSKGETVVIVAVNWCNKDANIKVEKVFWKKY